jgi:hypothetical protein
MVSPIKAKLRLGMLISTARQIISVSLGRMPFMTEVLEFGINTSFHLAPILVASIHSVVV